jgi:integrase
VVLVAGDVEPWTVVVRVVGWTPPTRRPVPYAPVRFTSPQDAPARGAGPGAAVPLPAAQDATLALPFAVRSPGSPEIRRPFAGPSATALAVPLSAALLARTAESAQRPLADGSRAGYAADWRKFTAWCAAHGLPALPTSEATLQAYVNAMADGSDGLATHRYPTIHRNLTSIRVHHADAGFPIGTLPGLGNTLANVRRRIGVATKAKRALLPEHLRAISAALPDTPVGARDRVVVLLGWAVGQRRADIATIAVEDLTFEPAGLRVRIRKSKTDQDRRGMTVDVSPGADGACPIAALRAWLAISGIRSGPVLRAIGKAGRLSDRALAGSIVSRIVQRAVRLIGLDPEEYGGHSLRRGLVTSAIHAGKSEESIMATTGHKSVQQLRGYIDGARPIAASAGAGLLGAVPDDRPVDDPFVREVEPSGEAYRVDLATVFFDETPDRSAVSRVQKLNVALARFISDGSVAIHVIDVEALVGQAALPRVDVGAVEGSPEHTNAVLLAAVYVEHCGKFARLGGEADVSAVDGSIAIRCGAVSRGAVLKALVDGQTIGVLPYGTGQKLHVFWATRNLRAEAPAAPEPVKRKRALPWTRPAPKVSVETDTEIDATKMPLDAFYANPDDGRPLVARRRVRP